MSTDARVDTRSRWGRARFAGGTLPAMAVAIPVGLVLSVGVGALTLLTPVSRGRDALLVAGVFALVVAWGLVGLVWALVVDHNTLKGALDNPEESVESRWLDAAMAGALRDTVMLTGLGLAVLAISGYELDSTWALTGVIIIAFFSTVVRYLMASRRG